MTYRLVFSYNRETMTFIVKDREIFYTDRKFKNWIRCIPPPENFLKAVALSRNRISANFINIFKFTEEEIKEYQSANSEEELSQIIIKDAKTRGVQFVLKEQIDDETFQDSKFIR